MKKINIEYAKERIEEHLSSIFLSLSEVFPNGSVPKVDITQSRVNRNVTGSSIILSLPTLRDIYKTLGESSFPIYTAAEVSHFLHKNYISKEDYGKIHDKLIHMAVTCRRWDNLSHVIILRTHNEIVEFYGVGYVAKTTKLYQIGNYLDYVSSEIIKAQSEWKKDRLKTREGEAISDEKMGLYATRVIPYAWAYDSYLKSVREVRPGKFRELDIVLYPSHIIENEKEALDRFLQKTFPDFKKQFELWRKYEEDQALFT